LIRSEAIVGLPEYQVTGIEESEGRVRIQARFTGAVTCPHCNSAGLRMKDRRIRRLRHESWGTRLTVLELETRKWLCRECKRSFWQRFPGILPRMRASEPFRRSVCQKHYDGTSRSRLGSREQISGATVERWFGDYLRHLAAQRATLVCPPILGIDEHFFTRKLGYATTFCDLKNHSIYDVVAGRSEAALESWLAKLEGKHLVKVVCMDLSTGYRALVRKHFPQARIVADRFHVIRVVNHHFLACWKELDPVGSKHRGLLSLMRRHRHNLKPEQEQKLSACLQQNPVLELVYRFKQKLCYLLLEKGMNQHRCRKLAPRLLAAIAHLRQSPLSQLVQLGNTLHSWKEEIATMWRFTRNNGITEGFHTKMEVLQRQAYGFRNFDNYRLRVKVMCS
jgi:transposase